MTIGPACPNCGKHVPFRRAQWGFGKTFPCTACGAALVVPHSYALVLSLGLFAVFWFTRHRFPDAWGGEIGLVAVLVVISLPMSWALVRARRADEPAPLTPADDEDLTL